MKTKTDVSANDLHSFTQNLNIPKLSDSQRLLCEGQLTYTECFDVLDKLKSDKSPGNDGLTAEFYKNSGQYLGTFW